MSKTLIPKPQISIILGTYNRLSMLQRCIESVRCNDITLPYEIIAIDGGSTDGSLEWLVQQTDIITIVQHNKVVVEGKKQNKYSWGYFMNIAFDAAHAECICMISDDCYVYPGTIMAGYETWQQSASDVGAVAFRFRNVPEEKEFTAGRTIYNILFVNHGMYKKSIFQKLGGFDEDAYEFYKADSDYCLRLEEQGYRTIVAESTRVDHYPTEDEIRLSNIENDQMTKDRQIYLARWSRSPRAGWLLLRRWLLGLKGRR